MPKKSIRAKKRSRSTVRDLGDRIDAALLCLARVHEAQRQILRRLGATEDHLPDPRIDPGFGRFSAGRQRANRISTWINPADIERHRRDSA